MIPKTPAGLYIVFGTLVTQFSLVFLGLVLVDSSEVGIHAEPLVLATLGSALLFFAAGHTDSHALRAWAVATHIGAGWTWMAWVASFNAGALPLMDCVLVTMCVLAGAAFCYFGAELTLESHEEVSEDEKETVKIRTLSPLVHESGSTLIPT